MLVSEVADWKRSRPLGEVGEGRYLGRRREKKGGEEGGGEGETERDKEKRELVTSY